jgi:cob(I)alamin adenosyltransferase
MLYTGKGDKGTTKTFGCNQRISKSSAIAEALGSLDEINSFLGFCKTRSYEAKLKVDGKKVGDIVHGLQQSLFIVQAEVAGAPKTIDGKKVKEMEAIISEIEKQLPPIKTFFISGGTELAATFDFARTIARRAERRVTLVSEEGKTKIGEATLSFLNRLSSVLYALARFTNNKSGITEEAPSYK